jgi:hypothetical protein
MKLKNVGLVALLALVGCDQKPPAGVGVGSTEAISSTDSAEVTRSKVLEVARTHGMVQRTPVLPLLVRAISSYKAPEKYALVEPAACGLANGNTGSYYSTLVQLRAEPVANKAVIEGLEAFFQDSAEYHALCARERINLVMMPRSGWDSTNQQDMVDFAKLVYLLGDGAAEMLAPIAAELSVMNGATEAEIIALAQQRFVSAAPEFNRVFLERDKTAKLHLMLDKTGRGAPVHYQVTTEGADVAIDAYGLLLVKNGVEWLGRGYVKGTSYTIETVSQQAVTMAKGTSMGTGQNSLNSQSTDATGGIK